VAESDNVKMPDNVDNVANATTFSRNSVDYGSQRRPKTPKTPVTANSKKKFDLEGSIFIEAPFKF
jgi:hypothetical protein